MCAGARSLPLSLGDEAQVPTPFDVEARAIFARRVDAMVARTGADAFARPPPPPAWEDTMCGRGAALLRRFREVALAASAPPPPPEWGAGAL